MYRTLDLFAGIGGFSLGLERTGGFQTVAFCEIDKKAQLVLKKHWPGVPIYGDIKDLTSERLQADGIVPDVITGGFPCQDISGAGKGKGIVGERSGLWSEMFRLIGDVRPTWAIIENVSALRSKGLTLVLQDLCSVGYCAEWHCIPASAVGAPHQRDRIWIVAYPHTSGQQSSSGGGENNGNETGDYVGGCCEDVAYPMQQHQTQRGECSSTQSQGGGGGTEQGRSEGDAERQRSLRGTGGDTAEDVAHPNEPRLEGWLRTGLQECPSKLSVGKGSPREEKLSDQWRIEPNVGRVADGVPKRVDRLKQLGNSVVPQIPELLGRAILSTNALHEG